MTTARERLAQLVARSGMSQSEIARRLPPDGEPPQWLNNRLRGVTEIKADDLPRIAHAMRLPPALFLPPLNHQEAAPASYAEVFTQHMARAWTRHISPADRELLETMATALSRYRQRLIDEETRGAHEIEHVGD